MQVPITNNANDLNVTFIICLRVGTLTAENENGPYKVERNGFACGK